ncbi:MAG: hypothetical protein ABIQ35_08880 [Verrucomicrobiota bacterium]
MKAQIILAVAVFASLSAIAQTTGRPANPAVVNPVARVVAVSNAVSGFAPAPVSGFNPKPVSGFSGSPVRGFATTQSAAFRAPSNAIAPIRIAPLATAVSRGAIVQALPAIPPQPQITPPTPVVRTNRTPLF